MSIDKKTLIKAVKTFAPLVFGVVLVWISLATASAEERALLWQNIVKANYYWIIFSMFLGFLSHYIRAIRWKLQLSPLGCRVRKSTSFFAVMFAYLSNYGIPRSGEVLRAVTLSTYEDIKFDKAFGTIVTERIIDLFFLMILTAIGFLGQTGKVVETFEQYNFSIFWIFISVFFILLMSIIAYLLIKQSTNPIALKIKKFIYGLIQGIKSILILKQKGLYVFYSFLIWFLYLSMFYIVKFAFPETSSLGVEAILIAFIVGSFSISVTNSGIGLYPIAVGSVLTFYGVSTSSGEAFGWVLWASQTALIIVLGGLSSVMLSIMKK